MPATGTARGGGRWLRGDVVVLALVFLAAAAATVSLCASMSAGMAMPGGWTLTMAWMRMPGQGWLVAWGMFAGTWAIMMVAMMLPAVTPALLHRSPGDDARLAARLFVAAGYFGIWAAAGILVYLPGAYLADAAMASASLARLLPVAGGVVLMLAGVLQFTPWKARRLAHCRVEEGVGGRTSVGLPEDCCAPIVPRQAATPWGQARAGLRRGLRLGADCALCCTGLMAAFLSLGVMDVWAMAAIGAAIAAERLLPWPLRVARATGAVLLVLGAVAMTRAAR